MQVKRWDGSLPITEPGLYLGIPLEVYHGQKICPGPSVSSSGLRRVLVANHGSPAHFYSEWSGNPYAVRDVEQKAHFSLGRACHYLLLDQVTMVEFNKYFVTKAYPDFRTNEAKDWRDRMLIAGMTIVTLEDYDVIRGMARAIGDCLLVGQKYRNRKGEEVYRGMLTGLAECSGFWQDRETGLWVKIRPDAIPTDGSDAADLKTTTSVHPADVQLAVTKFAYHQQAALVKEGLWHLADMALQSFNFVWVEKKPPYCVAVSRLDEGDMLRGEQLNRYALRLIAKCIKEDRWPGPADDHVQEVNLQDWYRKRVDQLLSPQQQAAE